MSDVIIVGCGRVGSQLATMLSQEDNNVTVIDKDQNAFVNLGRDFNGATVRGIGFDEDVLIKAGIETCDVVAAVTQSDNTNLMIAEVADKLYHVDHVVCRLYNPKHEKAFTQLGIDFACGTTLVTEALYSKVAAGHDSYVSMFGDCEIMSFSLDLRAFNRKSIRVSEIERPHGIRIIAFERADGSTSSIPTADSLLYQGDTVMAVVRPQLVQSLQRFVMK